MRAASWDELLKASRSAKAVLSDWDGCLALRDRLVDGALEFSASANRLIIVSNNSTLPAAAFHRIAVQQGLRLELQDVHLAGQALIEEAVQCLPNRTAWVIGAPAMVEAAQAAGITLTDRSPDAVLVLRDTAFSYDKLTVAANLLRQGADFWASNLDNVHPVADGVVPETGALAAAIRIASGRRPDFIAGKPQPFLFRRAIAGAGADVADCIMIGDNLRTDIAGAKRLGLRAVLISSKTWSKTQHLRPVEREFAP